MIEKTQIVGANAGANDLKAALNAKHLIKDSVLQTNGL